MKNKLPSIIEYLKMTSNWTVNTELRASTRHIIIFREMVWSHSLLLCNSLLLSLKKKNFFSLYSFFYNTFCFNFRFFFSSSRFSRSGIFPSSRILQKNEQHWIWFHFSFTVKWVNNNEKKKCDAFSHNIHRQTH